MDTIFKMSKDLGLSQMVLSQVGDVMAKFGTSLSDKRLKNLLAEFNSKPGSFLFKHSYLIALFSVAFVQKMKWCSEEILSRFCLASVLHDMGFSDERVATYETSSTDEKIPSDIQKEISSHADKMAKVLEKDKEIHQDIIDMIRYHHFSEIKHKDKEVLMGRLSQQSCIFLMVHLFVIELYSSMFDVEKVPEILENVAAHFDQTIFKPLADTFKSEMNNILGNQQI